MKKVVLLVLLTCAGLAHYVNCQILLSPLSVISKVSGLILCSFAFSSVVLMVLVWASRGTWSTTQSRAYSNRLATLAKKEKEILAGLQKKEMVRTSKDYSEDHGLWCDGYCCMHNPKNLYYNRKENNHA